MLLLLCCVLLSCCFSVSAPFVCPLKPSCNRSCHCNVLNHEGYVTEHKHCQSYHFWVFIAVWKWWEAVLLACGHTRVSTHCLAMGFTASMYAQIMLFYASIMFILLLDNFYFICKVKAVYVSCVQTQHQEFSVIAIAMLQAHTLLPPDFTTHHELLLPHKDNSFHSIH